MRLTSKSAPGIVSLHKMVFVKMVDGKSAALKEGLRKIFSAGDFINGLESIVKVGADTVLGNTSIGEHEATDMFIVWCECSTSLRCLLLSV